MCKQKSRRKTACLFILLISMSAPGSVDIGCKGKIRNLVIHIQECVDSGNLDYLFEDRKSVV